MTATLRFWRGFHVEVDGVARRGGDIAQPVSITIAGAVKDDVKVIGTTTTWDAWASGAEEPLSDFDFLWIESELDGVQVELTIDKGAEVGREVLTITLKKDVPLVLADDAGFANYTVDFAGGTLDVIDQIRIRNPDGTNTANVRLFMAT